MEGWMEGWIDEQAAEDWKQMEEWLTDGEEMTGRAEKIVWPALEAMKDVETVCNSLSEWLQSRGS